MGISIRIRIIQDLSEGIRIIIIITSSNINQLNVIKTKVWHLQGSHTNNGKTKVAPAGQPH